MALRSGERLGPYEIQGALGAGGMGEVYRARDSRLQREVAVKVLPVGRLEDAGALRRFEQEARTLAALNHPNLLTVFDVGTTGDSALYLVTELLDGATLREKLAGGKLPQRTAVDFGMQMARGLAAAHEKGIIHRDLKPENIFCTGDGRVKILDFGLAKLSAEAGAEDKTVAETGTAAGVVLGTVGYMAPEQARGQAADARSDIFSLGCVLYEMLVGRRAFRGDSAADVISAILREDPPELSLASNGGSGSGVGTVPIALERIVRHCLEKEPRQRFQSASDVAFSLADLSSASGTTSGAMAATAAGPRARRRMLMAAAGTLGLAAAVGLTWWLKPSASSMPQFQRLTYEQGTIFDARFLPDGQGILGAAAWNNQPSRLFTGRLDASGLSPVLADAERVLAVKSGEAAVLQHVRAWGGWVETGTLATMPLAGGSPRPLLANVQYADYNPVHGDLAITRFHNDSSDFSVEYPIGHVLYQAPGWVSDLHFSRDGSRIAFLVHPNFGDDLGHVAVVDLAGHLSTVSPEYSSTQGLGWSPSDKEIWYSATSRGTVLTVFATTLSGHVRPLMSAPTMMEVQDVAADGRLLLLSQSNRLSAYLVNGNPPQPHNFTVMDWAYDPLLSADGQVMLVGDQDAGPQYSTFLRKADGSPPVRLGDGTPLALSPDGQWAVSVLPGSQQLVLLPTGAGETRQLTHGKIAFAIRYAAWLPDGQAILAEGTEPGHNLRTYEVSLNGAVKPVLPDHVIDAVVTPDGQSVLAYVGGSKQFSLYPLAGGAPQELPWLPAGYAPLRYAADGRGVYATHRLSPIEDQVFLLSPGGKPQLLYSTSASDEAGVSGRTVTGISADGKTFAVGGVQHLGTLYVASGVGH